MFGSVVVAARLRVCLTWSIDGAPKQEIGENEVIVGLVQSVVSILYS
jgi:hypothetical protein